jgi:hypothetical protein
MGKMTKVINLYGGPGVSKSTTATGVFSILKLHGVSCEYVSEYAKDLTWEKARNNLENQVKIFGEQQHRMWRLIDQVDVIITDSPLPLCMIYNKAGCEELNKLVLSEYGKMNNYNYILKRIKPYVQVGRNQTEEEAKKIDEEVRLLLQKNKMDYKQIDGTYEAINVIVKDILDTSPEYFVGSWAHMEKSIKMFTDR